MASSTSAEDKYDLITRGLQEVLGAESIKAILDQGKTPKCYWGAYVYVYITTRTCTDDGVVS